MAKRYRGPGYQSYYGRRTSGAATLLKWIIVFLLALLVVAVGVYFLMRGWLVYDGDQVRVVFPWTQGEQTGPIEPSPSVSASEPVVVLPSDPEPTPTPTLRELAGQTLQAVELTQTGLLSGRAEEQVRTAGGNAALIQMKRDDGTLSWVSSVPLAAELNASASDSGVNQAIRELTGGEVYTIAEVSCFRDQLMGTQEKYALLTNSGWRWRDVEEVRWTCAANTEVQDYLVDLCAERAAMGFDELLLTNCGYPTGDMGNLSWIRRGDAYPRGELDTVVGRFLERVREALEPYGTRLSVKAVGSELAGETAETGLSADCVRDSCDHFWMDAAEAEAFGNFGAASGGLGKKLVPTGVAAGAADSPWAILNGT